MIALRATVVLIALAGAPFALYAAAFGVSGLTRSLVGETRFALGAQPVDALMFAHMLAGGLITVLAPLQLVGRIRRQAPGAHRAIGRATVALALLTALGGAAYIAARGTIGGAPMSASFAVYGALLALAAAQTVRFARRRAVAQHRAWALRFVALALGSWLYRLHYGLWEMATGGALRADDFSGAFDLANLVLFYAPYLALVELYLRRVPYREKPPSMTSSEPVTKAAASDAR